MKILIIAFLFFLLSSCTNAVESYSIDTVDPWPSNEITYSIDAIHIDGVKLIRANEIIHRAFRTWEATGAVKFRHVMHGQIKVSTEDLKNNQAGYGYHPSDGRLQLDDSNRTWTESLLYRVMLHEISHCLGVRHSNNSDSIFYYKVTSNDKISQWDKAVILELYSKKPKGEL